MHSDKSMHGWPICLVRRVSPSSRRSIRVSQYHIACLDSDNQLAFFVFLCKSAPTAIHEGGAKAEKRWDAPVQACIRCIFFVMYDDSQHAMPNLQNDLRLLLQPPHGSTIVRIRHAIRTSMPALLQLMENTYLCVVSISTYSHAAPSLRNAPNKIYLFTQFLSRRHRGSELPSHG